MPTDKLLEKILMRGPAGPPQLSLNELGFDDGSDPKVNTPHPAYVDNLQLWGMLSDLRGGTERMRAGAERYLPIEDGERQLDYHARVHRSFLFNAFDDAIDRLVGKPFSRPVVLEGSLPEQLDLLPGDMTGSGVDVTKFTKNAFDSAIQYGFVHGFVDFSTMPEGATLEDERGARTTITTIEAPQLFAWQTEFTGAREVLTQVRWREIRFQQVGEWGVVPVEVIHVWWQDRFQRFRRFKSNEEFQPFEEGRNTLGEIPIVTLWLDNNSRETILTAKPPLEDLAWVNLEHFQSSSDQRNILRFARTGTLAIFGIDEEEAAKIEWGPNARIHSENENVRAEILEYKGNAIEAGFRDKEHLEDQMTQLGSRPFVERSSRSTATGKKIDESNNETLIQSWIRSAEGWLVNLFDMAGRWRGVELPDDFRPQIFSDFGVILKQDKDLDILHKSRVNKDLTRITYLNELKRRGTLGEMVDVDAENAELEQEAQDSLAAMAELTLMDEDGGGNADAAGGAADDDSNQPADAA